MSDSISKPSQHGGAPTGEARLTPLESPLQKYHRLQGEVAALQLDLSALSEVRLACAPALGPALGPALCLAWASPVPRLVPRLCPCQWQWMWQWM